MEQLTMDMKIEIREATAADKDAVMNIQGLVFDGEDYLPTYYDYFLSSATDCFPYVLLYEGQIIFYVVYQIIDGGETLITRAGRVNPKYERQGFAKYFGVYMADWRKEKDIRVHAFTISDANPALFRDSFKQINTRILTRQMPLYCVVVQDVCISGSQLRKAITLVGVTEPLMSTYFNSRLVQDYLWPERRMIVDMVPLKTINSNLRYIKGPNGFPAVFSDIRTEDGRCCGLLSFGTVYEAQKHPYHVNIDIFGDDTRSLMEHIVRHLLVLKSKVKGEAVILVIVQVDFDMEKLDFVFESFGIKRKIWYDSTKPSYRYSQLFVYERDALTCEF